VNRFGLTETEIVAMNQHLRAARNRVTEDLHPDGFNVGVNVGMAAGQTIAHAHVHLIPRYVGDVALPEGGVRNVIPGRGRYQV